MILGGRVHCFTFFFWVCFKMLTTSEGHSGYELPWSPMRIAPFISGPSYHDHHHSHNIGNYAGSCYLWDLALDSNTHYMDNFLKNWSVWIKLTSQASTYELITKDSFCSLAIQYFRLHCRVYLIKSSHLFMILHHNHNDVKIEKIGADIEETLHKQRLTQ